MKDNKELVINYFKRNGINSDKVIENYFNFCKIQKKKDINDSELYKYSLNFDIKENEIIATWENNVSNMLVFKENGSFYSNNIQKEEIPINSYGFQELSFDKYSPIFNEKEIEKLQQLKTVENKCDAEVLDYLIAISISEQDTESDAARYVYPSYEIDIKVLNNCLNFIKKVDCDSLQVWAESEHIEGRFYIEDQDYELYFYEEYTIITLFIYNNLDSYKSEMHRWKIMPDDYMNIVNIEDFLKKSVEF